MPHKAGWRANEDLHIRGSVPTDHICQHGAVTMVTGWLNDDWSRDCSLVNHTRDPWGVQGDVIVRHVSELPRPQPKDNTMWYFNHVKSHDNVCQVQFRLQSNWQLDITFSQTTLQLVVYSNLSFSPSLSPLSLSLRLLVCCQYPSGSSQYTLIKLHLKNINNNYVK